MSSNSPRQWLPDPEPISTHTTKDIGRLSPTGGGGGKGISRIIVPSSGDPLSTELKTPTARRQLFPSEVKLRAPLPEDPEPLSAVDTENGALNINVPAYVNVVAPDTVTVFVDNDKFRVKLVSLTNGAEIPWESHGEKYQMMQVLEGEILVETDMGMTIEKEITSPNIGSTIVSTGRVIIIDAGVRHRVANVSGSTTKFLVTYIYI